MGRVWWRLSGWFCGWVVVDFGGGLCWFAACGDLVFRFSGGLVWVG